jgi:hypothetical protein
MSWIKDHWEKKYVDKAEDDISALVRLVFIYLDGVSSASKMREYRKKIDVSGNEAQSVQVPVRARSSAPAYMSLAAQYGLEDDFDIGEAGGKVQAVEQEYQAYITGVLSPKSLDILKFWEVSSDVIKRIFDLY